MRRLSPYYPERKHSVSTGVLPDAISGCVEKTFLHTLQLKIRHLVFRNFRFFPVLEIDNPSIGCHISSKLQKHLVPQLLCRKGSGRGLFTNIF